MSKIALIESAHWCLCLTEMRVPADHMAACILYCIKKCNELHSCCKPSVGTLCSTVTISRVFWLVGLTCLAHSYEILGIKPINSARQCSLRICMQGHYDAHPHPGLLLLYTGEVAEECDCFVLTEQRSSPD